VFSFIQRNPDEMKLQIEPNKPIKLIQDASSEQESGKTGFPGKQYSKTRGSSVISRNAKSLVGFNPVPIQQLEKNCEYLCRWYNTTLQSGSSLGSFPTDVINQNGEHIYQLINYLSGKNPPGRAPKNALTANL